MVLEQIDVDLIREAVETHLETLDQDIKGDSSIRYALILKDMEGMTKIQKIPVVSSNLISVGYAENKKVLQIEFKTGTYLYFDVPKTVFHELMLSKSIGQFFHEVIKEVYKWEKQEDGN